MSDDTLFILLFIWGTSALVAGAIASDRERSFFGFAALTFFFLGPLGPGFAAIATHGAVERAQLSAAGASSLAAVPAPPAKRNVPKGRQRFICPRCGAESDIPIEDVAFDCWRCHEQHTVAPKPATT